MKTKKLRRDKKEEEGAGVIGLLVQPNEKENIKGKRRKKRTKEKKKSYFAMFSVSLVILHVYCLTQKKGKEKRRI